MLSIYKNLVLFIFSIISFHHLMLLVSLQQKVKNIHEMGNNWHVSLV
jgi:hypothetical protein